MTASAQFSLPGKRKAGIINFTLVKNLIIISLEINQRGPYNFILDSGVGFLLITDPHLIDSLHLDDLRNIKVSGFGTGNDLNAFIAPSLELNISQNIKGRLAAAILKKDAFNLSSYTGIPIHGLLGYEFFNSFVVKINYGSQTIRVYDPARFEILPKGIKVPLTIEEGKPYTECVVTLPSGNKLPVKLVIDTGAGHPVSLETFAGMPFELPSQKIQANLGVGLLGAIEGYIARIPALRIGRYELKDVVTSFPDYSSGAARLSSISRNGNLGNVVLKRFNVVFDYSRGAMYLKPTAALKEPFEHDMSGLELVAEGPGLKRIFIGRVEKGSVAADLGLEAEDELLAVNFKPVSEMDMEVIYSLLRSGDNKNVLLKIRPKGKTTTDLVVLTLKRRI